MIRFRTGQTWKRERSATPVDSFGLELDGVDVLAGANEEQLTKVVPALVDGLVSLGTKKALFAQVSLPEAHLELVLRRREDEVELWIVSLGRPARLVRPPLRVDLTELMAAAGRCARGFLDDLREALPRLAASTRHQQLLKRLTALERGPSSAELRPPPQGYAFRSAPSQSVCFAFSIEDPEDLLMAPGRGGCGALGTLLCSGQVSLRLTGESAVWSTRGLPLLLAIELSRQATELVTALETKERQFSFTPAGVGPSLEVDLEEGAVAVGPATFAASPRLLAQAMFELGMAFAFAVGSRNKAQAKNPYLTELVARCQQGLAHLRGGVAPVEGKAAKAPRKRAASEHKPLKVQGRLRRLRFEKLWEKTGLGGDPPGLLRLGSKGPVFISAGMACGFSPTGEVLFRRSASHGVAATADGRVLAATDARVLGYVASETGARWLRDHDGIRIGAHLERREGVWVTLSEGRTALAFSELTGRELWRLAPPRTQQIHLSVQGHRALVATDSGYLYGVDLQDGQLRYRMQAALPFLWEPVPWGKRLVSTLGRDDRTAVLAADAHSGTILWTHEAALRAPTRPLPQATRVLIAGERDGEGALLCLGGGGQRLWERPLRLDRGPLQLTRLGKQTLASSRAGAATLVGPDGSVEWTLGTDGEEPLRDIQPVVSRSILLLPGERVRAVDLRGGQVLAEVHAGIGLCDVKADSRLNLYLLDEDGTLSAYRLASHLAVVS